MNYSKNNRNLRNSKMMDQKPHYALRKLSVGVASVLLSTTLYMMESGNAQAATTSSNQTNQSLVQNTKNGGDNSQPTAQTGVNKQEADTQKQAKTPTTVEANAVSDTQTTEKTYKANLVDSTNQVIKTLTANGNVGATVNTNWTATDLPTGWKLADKQSLPTEVTINSDDAQNTANITIEHALRPATDEELKDLYNLSDDPGHSMYEIQKVYTRYISYYNGKYMPLAFPVDDESGWMNAIKGGRYVEQFVRYTWDTQIDEVTNKPVFSNFKLAEIKTKIFDGSTFSNDDLKYMADTYYLHGKYLDAMRKGALSILLSDNRLSKYVQVVTGSYELQGESYQFKPGCVYSIADAMSFPMMTKKVEHYTTPQFTNKGVSFNDIDFSNFDVQKEMDKVHKVWPSGSSLNSPADVASVLHDTYAIAYTPCDSEKFIHKQAISDADLNNLIANAKKSKVISDQDQEKWMVTPDTADVGSGVAVVKSGSIDNSLMWKVIPYTVLSTQDVDGPNVKTAKTPLSYMVGDTISDDDAAKALDKDTIPSDATVVWVTKPSTKEAGSQAGKVKVTFGDGTYQDYDVNVNVANYATAQVELVDGTGTVKDSVDSYAKTHLGKTVTTLTVQGKPGETVTTNWASQIPDGWQLAPNQTLPDTVTLSSDGTVKDLGKVTIEHKLVKLSDEEITASHLDRNIDGHHRYIMVFLPGSTVSYQFPAGDYSILSNSNYTVDYYRDEVTRDIYFNNMEYHDTDYGILDAKDGSGAEHRTPSTTVPAIDLNDIPEIKTLLDQHYIPIIKSAKDYSLPVSDIADNHTVSSIDLNNLDFTKDPYIAAKRATFSGESYFDITALTGDTLSATFQSITFVKAKDNLLYTKGATVPTDAKDVLDNVPSDATVTWVTKPDTSAYGEKTAKVHIAWGETNQDIDVPYKVASTKDVDGPNVKTAQTPLSYMVGDTISDDDAAKALNKDTIPSDATVVWVTKPSTKEAGSQAGKVKVTFGDGTYQDYDINVNVANYATAQVELVDGTGTVKGSRGDNPKPNLGKIVKTLTVQGKPGETVTTNWASQIPDGWQLAPNQTLPDTVTLSSDGTVKDLGKVTIEHKLVKLSDEEADKEQDTERPGYSRMYSVFMPGISADEGSNAQQYTVMSYSFWHFDVYKDLVTGDQYFTNPKVGDVQSSINDNDGKTVYDSGENKTGTIVPEVDLYKIPGYQKAILEGYIPIIKHTSYVFGGQSTQTWRSSINDNPKDYFISQFKDGHILASVDVAKDIDIESVGLSLDEAKDRMTTFGGKKYITQDSFDSLRGYGAKSYQEYEYGEIEFVKVKPEVTYKKGEQVASLIAKDTLDNVPSDAKVTWVTEPDTSTLGEKTAKVHIVWDGEYPADTNQDIEIPYKVVSTKDSSVKASQDVKYTKCEAVPEDAKSALTGVPSDATVTWTKKPNTENVGDGNATVHVVYGDGTSEDIDVPYMVTSTKDGSVKVSQNVKYTKGEAVPEDAKSALTGVPSDATVTWTKKPNTENVGDGNATVHVIYGDGTSEDITVPYKVESTKDGSVKASQEVKYTKGESVPEDAKSVLTGVPSDATVTWTKKPNTESVGSGNATVHVVYGDGTSEDITVPYKVESTKDGSVKASQDVKYTKGESVPEDAKSVLTGVPSDATVTWTKKPNTESVGSGNATVHVVYGDGTSEDITVPYKVESSKESDGTNITKSDTNISYKKGDSVTDTDAAKTLKNVPSDAKVTWLTKPDTSEIGKGKSAKVEVTFGNGDKQQYDVTYDVEDDTPVDPLAKVAKVDTPLVYKKGDTVTDTDAAKTLKNVPEGASVTWADGHKPDTASFGKGKSAQVVVTKNGQSKTIDVTYDVDSSKDIEGKNITKSDTNLSYKKGDSVADTDAAKTLKNVPSDATAAWITKPDTSEIGKGKSAKVEVTFGNGDKQQYDVVYDVFGKPKSSGDEDQDPLSEVVPIKVAPKFEEGKPVTDTDAAKAVTGVPEGATVTWTKGHEPDTSKPGTGKSAQVTVTYKDKSKTIDITYDVTPKKTDEGQAKDPLSEVVPIKVAPKFEEGKPVTDTDAAKAITGVPEGATVTWTKGHEPDTSKPGTGKSAQVTVTYKDKSKTIDITYDVTPKKTDEGQAKDPLSEVVPIKVAPKFEEGKPVTDTDAAKAVTGVPEGATVTWTKGHEPDTSNPGTGKSAQVTVTYKDKSKTIDITYDVTPKKTESGSQTSDTPVPAPVKQSKDADTYKPEVKPIKVVPGQTPNPEDAIGNKDKLPAGTTYTWKGNQAPDTSVPGTGSSTIVITYPDGSKSEVQVDVETASETKSSEDKAAANVTPAETKVNKLRANKHANVASAKVNKAKRALASQANKKLAINKQKHLPQTGNHTTALQALGLAVIALTGLAFFDKKKKQD